MFAYLISVSTPVAGINQGNAMEVVDVSHGSDQDSNQTPSGRKKRVSGGSMTGDTRRALMPTTSAVPMGPPSSSSPAPSVAGHGSNGGGKFW